MHDSDSDKLEGLQAMMDLPGHVHVEPDAAALHEALAEGLWRRAQEAIEQRGVFHLALSGGNTPEPLYRQLVIGPEFRAFPWQQTHIWLTDERQVPEDDQRANINVLRQNLVDHLPLTGRQIHPIPATDNDPATAYEQALAETIGGHPPRLDFILLGMGEDCHTASLFPHSPALEITERWVATNAGDTVTPPPRVTLTYPVINAARAAVVLVTGGRKAEAMRRVEDQFRAGRADHRELPIMGVQPRDGVLAWYLDAPATGVVGE